MEKPNIQVQSLRLESFMEWGTVRGSLFLWHFRRFSKRLCGWTETVHAAGYNIIRKAGPVRGQGRQKQQRPGWWKEALENIA